MTRRDENDPLARRWRFPWEFVAVVLVLVFLAALGVIPWGF